MFIVSIGRDYEPIWRDFDHKGCFYAYFTGHIQIMITDLSIYQ